MGQVCEEYVAMVRPVMDAWDGEDTAQLILDLIAATGEPVEDVLREAWNQRPTRKMGRAFRPVVCPATGERWPSVKACAAALGVAQPAVPGCIRRGCRCKGRYLAYEGEDESDG